MEVTLSALGIVHPYIPSKGTVFQNILNPKGIYLRLRDKVSSSATAKVQFCRAPADCVSGRGCPAQPYLFKLVP